MFGSHFDFQRGDIVTNKVGDAAGDAVGKKDGAK